MAAVDDAAKLPHKTRKTGGKVKKKESKDKKERHNPKAFTFSGGINSVQKRAQRTLDLQTKRENANIITNKTIDLLSSPPLIVVVQGPEGVGKSTLIKSLVKHYSKRNISIVTGPITVVCSYVAIRPMSQTSGKARRLTFVECPNDAASMLDYAKVADLVLLLIDGSFGFEMETFEFLNILQVHGFPRILGVLTHLDGFTEVKTLRRTKKKLKNRFWAELYDGAKLFYLSGLQHGRYNTTEILNLTRFISVQKVTPLSFRSQRPYLLSLRYEDHTPSNVNQDGPRRVHFYGYLKGATIRTGVSVHVPGAGDFAVSDVSEYPDPCALPHTKRDENKRDGGRALRTLKADERKIYAPGCDVGNVQYEADAVYIHLPEHKEGFTKKEDLEKDYEPSDDSSDDSSSEDDNHIAPEAVRLVRKLQESHLQLSSGVEAQTLQLLPTSTHKAVKKVGRREVPAKMFKALGGSNNREAESSDSMLSDENDSIDDIGYVSNDDGDDGVSVVADKGIVNDSVEDKESRTNGSDCNNEEVETAAEDASDGDDCSEEEEEEADDSSRLVASTTSRLIGRRQVVDQEQIARKFQKEPTMFDLVYGESRTEPSVRAIQSLTSGTTKRSKQLFEDDQPVEQTELVSALFGATFSSERDLDESSGLSDDQIYECLGFHPTTLKEVEIIWSSPAVSKALKATRFITGGWDGPDPTAGVPVVAEMTPSSSSIPARVDTEIVRQREALRKRQDEEKAGIEEAQRLIRDNNSGIVLGTYIRVIVDGMPANWLAHAKATNRTAIMGGLLPGEVERSSFLQCRVKRHRWAPKVLKSDDPVLISIGWRRLQVLPLYSLEDRGNVRIRMLKYTPEHLHCLATFYSPLVEPGAGVLAIRNWTDKVKHFRISFTGLVLEASMDFAIMKKLKLVGEPNKVFKKTAFIRNMFTSDLEVAKCIGAKIQTVSGIRGQIKKAQGQDGTCRASFEDKILMSDVVLCKAWIRVQPKEFCNHVLDVPNWRRVRQMAEIRAAFQLPYPDSNNYGGKPVRVIKRFNPLQLPKDLEKNLTFKSLPKNESKKKKLSTVDEVTACSLTDYEKKVATLFNRLHLMTKVRKQEKCSAFAKKINKKKLAELKIQEKRNMYSKESRKKRYAKEGMEREKTQKRMRLND